MAKIIINTEFAESVEKYWEENQMNEISKEELERIARKQSEVIKQLHNYIFMNESIPEVEREFILANLDTVLRLY